MRAYKLLCVVEFVNLLAFAGNDGVVDCYHVASIDGAVAIYIGSVVRESLLTSFALFEIVAQVILTLVIILVIPNIGTHNYYTVNRFVQQIRKFRVTIE